MVGSNFAKAVAGAIEETRRQWRDFRAELEARYGAERASLMVCALSHDDPTRECRGGGFPATVAAGVLVGVVGVGVVLFGMHRLAGRRRRTPTG
jgi:hypothetical protein